MIRSYSILPSPPQEWFMVEDGVVSAGTLRTLEDLWLLSPLSSPRSQPLSPHQLWTSISLSPLTHLHHSSAQIVPELSRSRDTCPGQWTRHPSPLHQWGLSGSRISEYQSNSSSPDSGTQTPASDWKYNFRIRISFPHPAAVFRQALMREGNLKINEKIKVKNKLQCK